jgi:transglutaminase-like putative cysteine protease
MENLDAFLKPGRFINSDHPLVRETVAEILAGAESAPEAERARRVFDFARDKIWFSPWEPSREDDSVTASTVLRTRKGFCAHKGVALTALARAAGIPARVGMLDMRNHQAAERLKQMLRTNVFIGGAFTDMYVNGRWTRFTPVFNVELCQKLGWPVVRWNGVGDAMWPPVLADGRPYIEVLTVHGVFEDWPHDLFKKLVSEFYSSESLKEWETVKSQSAGR